MPAIDAHRIFLSTVTAELARYRTVLADRFKQVSVQAVYQEEFEYADVDLIEKLYTLITPCDVVIHFVGAGAGAKANPAAVQDFLQHCEQRGDNFLGFWKANYGLDRDFFDQLTYTQWEAVIAVFMKKHFMSLQPSGPVTDGHPIGQPPFTPTAVDAASQERHLAWLSKTIRRYPQTIELQNGSYLEDAFNKTLGFLLRLNSPAEPAWPQQAAASLQQLYPAQKIAGSRLVSRHTAADFLGREDELRVMDDAWGGTAMVNVLSIIAWGGAGKTALLGRWVQSRFIDQGWKNAEGRPDPLFYFDWTFYDQGTRPDDATHAGAASVGSFFETALTFFGDPDPNLPGKGERLARLVQAHRTLLVLDGLEPLQYPFNHPQAGRITDPDLRVLLTTLAAQNPGLCVVTSRQVLTDLSGLERSTARKHDLDELPEEVAIRLLRQMQIKGSDADLQQAVTDYFGHALSLTLLGRFLFQARGGDIRKRDTIKFEKASKNRDSQTRNAWHVLEAYEQWLASPDGRAEDRQALRLTGLFDRPASPDCLAALLRAPAIAGLTDTLVPLDNDDWNALLRRLHDAHLIQLRFPASDPASTAPQLEPREVPVDVHPLIREYFAKQLRDQQRAAYESAHSRLFDHLCQKTEHRPATLDGLQPLYQAVVHGCLAGRQQEAREKVYRDRILRGTGSDGNYSTFKLGAIGADLGAVAAFFEVPWSQLSSNLSEPAQAWLLNEAAFSLRALGRLTDALEPMRVGMEMRIKAENWQNAAISASNLSELEVTLGRLGEAESDARRAIDFADRSRDANWRMASCTTAADALHQFGDRDEARQLFEEAEKIQIENQPKFNLLYSLRGYQYCDLILAPAERAAWRSTGVPPVNTRDTAIPPPHQEKHGQDGHATVPPVNTPDTAIPPPDQENHGRDGHATVKRQGAHLPHWTQTGATYAVTFRLADSLPAGVLRTWNLEREELTRTAKLESRPLTHAEQQRLRQLHSERVEKYLDAGAGNCWMKNPKVADLIESTLKHFDGDRYHLLAWCVMPNHVHVVVQPLGTHSLPDILHSWKSYSSRLALKLVGQSGTFWQAEYYDHIIRDEDDLWHAIEYILANPTAAGLQNWRWVGRRESLSSFLRSTGVPPVILPDTAIPVSRTEDHGQDSHATGEIPGSTGVPPVKLGTSVSALSEEGHGRDGHATALADAERRATQTLEWGDKFGSLLTIALDHLTLARVGLYRAMLDGARVGRGGRPLVEIMAGTAMLRAIDNPHVQLALDGLRDANQADQLPKALLTAAVHQYLTGDTVAARRLLDEAQQIAERGPMPLYLADVHLHRARLFRDKSELAKARTLIEQHHYHRRLEELAGAESAAASW